MEAETSDRRCSSLTSHVFANIRKVYCFFVTRATKKQHKDPEVLVLSLTRMRKILVEMEVKELSLPVYDPNRGPQHPRDLYALIHLIFSDINIQVYLHKKNNLSLG